MYPAISQLHKHSQLCTLALASLVASASAAMARCISWGRLTSLLWEDRVVHVLHWTHIQLCLMVYCTYISTLSTLTPHGSVASSSILCWNIIITGAYSHNPTCSPIIRGIHSHSFRLWLCLSLQVCPWGSLSQGYCARWSVLAGTWNWVHSRHWWLTWWGH